ncbi:MAG: hypothetical protein Kow0075_03730 [Salibacteraceae bacterium]
MKKFHRVRTAAILLTAMALVMCASCRRDVLYSGSDAKVRFSTDTVFFDTVFTTVGSITERLKIYNPYDEALVLDMIWLERGESSNFKLNVDGFKGRAVSDVRIEPLDSIFVFIEVTVDPNGGNSPMVIEEKLRVETNGNTQSVTLVAWGQDAYFFSSTRLRFSQPVSLFTDKPNVFYGYTLVDTNTTLVIPCGARVHFHANSGLIVGHEASLKILGCQDDPVIIQGDRLEDYFKDVPGQWGQIYLSATSKDNEIRNAIIKNGSLGVRVDSNINENPSLLLENTIIANMSYIGLLGQGADIVATNCVFARTGEYTVALAFGGNYQFTHCTFANYWSENPRGKPTLYLNNYFEVNKKVYPRDFSAEFTNCIIHGNLESELEREWDKGAKFDYTFDHVLIKLDTENIDLPNFVSTIKATPEMTSSTLFANAPKDNYRPSEGSKLIDAGKDAGVPFDLEGKNRVGAPDLGAYEYSD